MIKNINFDNSECAKVAPETLVMLRDQVFKNAAFKQILLPEILRGQLALGAETS